MFRKWYNALKNREKEKSILLSIIQPYASFYNQGDQLQNEEAKQALIGLYKKLLKYKPDKEYLLRDSLHIIYVYQLVNVKMALHHKKYRKACHELMNTIHDEPLFQRRVYYNVLKLLNDELRIEENENAEKLFIKKKAKVKKIEEFEAKKEFRHAIQILGWEVEALETKEDKTILLNYVLTAIREDIKTDLLTAAIYNSEPHIKQSNDLFPQYFYDEDGNKKDIQVLGASKKINLKEAAIITIPWRVKSIVACAVGMFKESFKYEKNKHCAHYYLYANIAYVWNGNHSIAAGVIYKKGTIIATEVYDVRLLFPHVTTDGVSWFNLHCDKNLKDSKISDVFDFRIGIIYEIAKLKYEIEGSNEG